MISSSTSPHPLAAGLSNPITGNAASHAHLAGCPANAHVVIVTGTDATSLATLYVLQPCE